MNKKSMVIAASMQHATCNIKLISSSSERSICMTGQRIRNIIVLNAKKNGITIVSCNKFPIQTVGCYYHVRNMTVVGSYNIV